MTKISLAILSTEDQDYVTNAAKSGASGSKDLTADLEKTKMGAIFAKAKLKKFDGKTFKAAEMAKVPEYYVLYYSASW